MATIVVAHGAWSGGWAWGKMRAIWTAAGHEVWTPTLTGLGERGHLANPAVDLETHVRDVVGLLDCEDLQEVVLIGHSYGGMVATGVAQRRPERLHRLVYLDALVPQPGASVFELVPAQAAARMRAAALAAGEGWRIPPTRCRPTPRRKMCSTPGRAGCRSRSAPSSNPCRWPRSRRCRTSICSAAGSARTTPSARSPGAPRPSRV